MDSFRDAEVVLRIAGQRGVDHPSPIAGALLHCATSCSLNRLCRSGSSSCTSGIPTTVSTLPPRRLYETSETQRLIEDLKDINDSVMCLGTPGGTSERVRLDDHRP